MKYLQIMLVVVVLIIILIPVAKVYATNESSYRLGLKFGYDEFRKCDTTCLNLDALGLDCQANQHVDNVTSCNEGYAHIWLEKGQTQTQVATCILSGHTWDAGGCQSGKLVGITTPGHCYNNGTYESGEWTRLH